MADLFFQYPRSESNRDQRNRNPLFYPLNYRGIPLKDCKFSKNISLTKYTAEGIVG